MSNLAIDGGKPYRKTPFPERTPYGEEEVALVTEAIRSQDLFGLGGPKVSAPEAEFARLYGAKHAVAWSLVRPGGSELLVEKAVELANAMWDW